MNLGQRLVASLLVGFGICALVMPFLVRFMKKRKMKQVILHYVDMHSGKAGTPTMGGIGFIFAYLVASIIFARGETTLTIMSVIVCISFAIIGFLDDFIKFKFKQNRGLRPYQKIISQLVVAVAVAVFASKSIFVGGELFVPFISKTINIGWGIIPFAVFIFLATTNSVNLTDGLDGLASLTSIAFLASFVVILFLEISGGMFELTSTEEYSNLMVSCSAMVGALIGFLLFNGFPAKIFMGDTGSLALGGMIASVCIFSRNSLYIPILGIMFVLSSVSVILQVAYFKKTHGKRIFLMSPLHHHFEKKGISEVKIVVWYAVITLVVGLSTAFILMI